MYDERLGVPLRWWALATMFLATMLLAFLVATPLWVAFVGTAVLVILVLTLFLGYGAARISVHDGVLTAGRARIPLVHVGEVVPLDAWPGATRTPGRTCCCGPTCVVRCASASTTRPTRRRTGW